MNEMCIARCSAMRGLVMMAGLLLSAPCVTAQDQYPSKQIRIVVGSLAGGTTDVAARALAARLVPLLKQPVVIDNKPGAGGAIAGKEVAGSRPDGYTLQMGSTSTNTLAPLLQTPVPFDLLADFEPVQVIGFVPLTLFVPQSLPVKSVHELIALAKASPGKLSYASAGLGTTSHLTGELFKMLGGGLHIVHIPYRGGPAMDMAVATGEVQLSFDSPGAISELHHGGKVRALAVLAEARSDKLPEVPTTKESGYPDLVSLVSFYVLAPAKTPAPVLNALDRAIQAAVATPEFRADLQKAGIQPLSVESPAAARAFVKNEVDHWSRVVKTRNIKIDQP